jgi:hypothetical protein
MLLRILFRAIDLTDSRYVIRMLPKAHQTLVLQPEAAESLPPFIDSSNLKVYDFLAFALLAFFAGLLSLAAAAVASSAAAGLAFLFDGLLMDLKAMGDSAMT